MKTDSESQLNKFRESKQHEKPKTKVYGLHLFKPKQIEEDFLVKYRNAVYMGELLGKKKHGLGILLYNTGEIYFGEFENDKMHGNGIMIFCVGFYMRGCFSDGKLDGNVMMRSPNGKTFLMRFSSGVLNGVSSILKRNNWVKVVEFEDGKIKQVLKNFKANDDQFSKKLIDSVFEIDYEAREEISSFTEQLSKSLLSWDKEIYFGTFSVLEHGIYYGMIKHGQPSGFGIYFSDKGKIKTGWFRDGAMVGKTRIIDSGGLIMDSNFKNDQACGDTLIYHIKKNDWKQVFIEYNKVEEMDCGKGYPRYELNRQNRWTGMIKRADYEVPRELSTIVIDVNGVHELLLILVSGVTKRTFGVFEDSFGAKKLTFDHTQEWSIGYSDDKESEEGKEAKATVETRRILQKYEVTERNTTPGSQSKRSNPHETNIKSNLNFSESSIYRSEKKNSNRKGNQIKKNVYFSNQKTSLSPRKSLQHRFSCYRLSVSKGIKSSQKKFSMKIEEEDYETYAKQSIALGSVKKRLKHKIKLKKKTIRPYSPYEQRQEIHERVRKKVTYVPRSFSPYKRRRRIKIPKYIKKHVSPYSLKRKVNIIERVPSTRSIWRYTKNNELEDPHHHWETTFQNTINKVKSEYKESRSNRKDVRELKSKARRDGSFRRLIKLGKKDYSNLGGRSFKYTFNQLKSKPYDRKKEEDANMRLIRGIYKDVISNYVDIEEYEKLLELKDNEAAQEGAKDSKSLIRKFSGQARAKRRFNKNSPPKDDKESEAQGRLIKLSPEELRVFKGLRTLAEKRLYLEKVKKSRLKLTLKTNEYTLKKNDGPLSFRKTTEGSLRSNTRSNSKRKRQSKTPKMSLNLHNINFTNGLDLKSTERFGEFNNIRLEMKYGDNYCRYGKQDQSQIQRERTKENYDINRKTPKRRSKYGSSPKNHQTGSRGKFMDSKVFI